MGKKPRRTKKLERIAYHEAGHAVAAFLVRRAFRYVTIKPGEDSLGHILFRKFSDSFRPDIEYDEHKLRPPLEKVIITGLAGHAAESIYAGRNNWVGSRKDFHNAVDYATYLIGEPKELEAYMKWLLIHTRNKLCHPMHWGAVKALAEELLKQDRIGYRKARKIIYWGMNKAFEESRKTTGPPTFKIVEPA